MKKNKLETLKARKVQLEQTANDLQNTIAHTSYEIPVKDSVDKLVKYYYELYTINKKLEKQERKHEKFNKIMKIVIR